MARFIKSAALSNGLKLPYLDQGDPSGVPLILVHGYADSCRSFELLLPHLPKSIWAIALTQRGGTAMRAVPQKAIAPMISQWTWRHSWTHCNWRQP